MNGNISRAAMNETYASNYTMPADLVPLARSLANASFACCCLMLLLTLFGSVGNSLSVYVYLRRSNRNNCINILLAGLGLFDLAMLLFGTAVLFPTGLRVFLCEHNPAGCTGPSIFEAFAIRFLYPCMTIAQTGSVWCLTVITAERFLAVCYPFVARSFCTRKRTKIALASVAVTAVSYNGCRFFEYSLQPLPGGGLTVVERLRDDKVYHQVYTVWMYCFFMFSIPFAIIAGLTGKIIVEVRRANLSRQAMSRQQARESRTTEMMLVLVGIFMGANILPFALSIVEMNTALLHTSHRFSLWYAFLTDASNALVLLNSTTNFPIYMAFSRNFRRQVLAIVVPRKPLPPLEDASRISDTQLNIRLMTGSGLLAEGSPPTSSQCRNGRSPRGSVVLRSRAGSHGGAAYAAAEGRGRGARSGPSRAPPPLLAPESRHRHQSVAVLL